MKKLAALAVALLAATAYAGEPEQAPPVVYLPVPSQEATLDAPPTVLLAVGQCANGQCVTMRPSGFTTWTNPQTAVAGPQAVAAASGCTTGCSGQPAMAGVGRPRLFGRMFAADRPRLFGGCCGK